MSSNPKQSSGVPPIALILIGIVVMVSGGVVAHLPQVMELEDNLAKQGIPLNPGETIATIGVLLILFQVINTFFLKPLVTAIDERNTNLERTFGEAESLRTEMQRLRSEYEARFAAAEEDNRTRIQAEFAKAKDLAEKAKLEAEANRDSYLENARREIESEKQKLLVELRTSVVDISLAAAEKVIGENMDNARNRKLVSDFIEKVEVVA